LRRSSRRHLLQAGVRTLRLDTHLSRHLVGEAGALLSDRVRHSRAARDRVYQPPQLLALEQPLDDRVQQAAVDHSSRQPVHFRAVHEAVGDPIRHSVRQQAVDHPLRYVRRLRAQHGLLEGVATPSSSTTRWSTA
jgi:hypothetical protein